MTSIGAFVAASSGKWISPDIRGKNRALRSQIASIDHQKGQGFNKVRFPGRGRHQRNSSGSGRGIAGEAAAELQRNNRGIGFLC